MLRPYFTSVLDAKAIGWNGYLLCFLAMLGGLSVADFFERIVTPKD